MKLFANIDGASFGNPGKSGLGVVLKDSAGKVVREHSEHLGDGTNNRAEYLALLRSIQLARESGADELEVSSDSELVVSQMNGVYRIKNRELKTLAIMVNDEIRKANLKFTIRHIPREMNSAADRLAKKGADAFVPE